MDLDERIARRRNRRADNRLVADWDPLNPTVHLKEPNGREALFEALLDAIDPLFDGDIPQNVYVWGPEGSGKSAILTALVSALKREMSSHRPQYTATRGESGLSETKFVYLDARRATSRFQMYRLLLDALRPESVPERGVSTEELRTNIEAELVTVRGVLVIVDHLGEPETEGLDDVHRYLQPFEDAAWIGIGRKMPGDLPLPMPEVQVHVPQYSQELVDILTVRGTRGLSGTLDHVHARRIADWAEGNAHDALAALFAAALHCESKGKTRLRDEDVDAGIEAVPTSGVPISRVLGLSDNERRVVATLLALPGDSNRSIEAASEQIAERTELKGATVKRLLYELAQRGILERSQVASGQQVVGRQPSTVTPNFSVTLFDRFYDP